MSVLQIGESISLVLFDAAAKGTALLAVACLTTLGLRRSSAAMRHRVWGLSMGGLVLLPALSWLLPAWRLPILPPRAAEAATAVAQIATEPESPLPSRNQGYDAPKNQIADARSAAPTEIRQESSHAAISPVSPPMASQSPSIPTAVDAESGGGIWMLSGVACVWGLGTSLLLVGVAIGIRRTRRLWHGSQSIIDEAWSQLARELCSRLGLRRRVHLREHSEPVVPLTWGLLRPIILLPEQARRWTDSMKRAVLLHELAHVHRGDVAFQLLGRCACAMYWFHPLAWFGLHRLRQEREQACDDAVVGAGERASDYAEQLLEVARRYRRAGGLALAVEITHGGSLEQRVQALFDAARSHAPVGRRLAVTLLLVTGVFVTAIAILRPVAAESQIAASEIESKANAPLADAGQKQAPAANQPADANKIDDKPAVEPRVSTHPVTITGVARNARGEPIPQARVYLLSTLYEDFRRVAEITTDAKGAYAFRDAPLPIVRPERNAGGDVHGAIEILGIADGYGFAWRPKKWFIAAPRPAPGEEPVFDQPPIDPPRQFWQDDLIELDLEFPAAASLNGRIVDEQNRPIAGVKVDMRLCERIHDEIEKGSLASPKIYDFTALNQPEDVPAALKIRKTDADGNFEFTGLPPECLFRFDVRHSDYAGRMVWAATTAVELPKLGGRHPILTGPINLMFQAVQSVKVRIEYTDTGKPAAGVHVSASGAGTSGSQTSNEKGEVTLRLPQGEYAVQLLPATGTPYLITRLEEKLVVGAGPAADPPANDAPTSDVTVFKMRRACVLEVTIVDADTGLPIPDVDLWIDARENPAEIGTSVQCSDFYFRSWHPPVADVERPVSDKEGKLRALVEPGLRRLGPAFNKRPAGYVPDRLGELFDCEAGQTLKVEFQLRKIAIAGPGRPAIAPPSEPTALDGPASVDHFQRFKLKFAQAQRLSAAKKPVEALSLLKSARRELALVPDSGLLTEQDQQRGLNAARNRSAHELELVWSLLSAGALDNAVEIANGMKSRGFQADALAKIAAKLGTLDRREEAIKYIDQALAAAQQEKLIPSEFARFWGDGEATWRIVGLEAVGEASHALGNVERTDHVIKLLQNERGKKGDAVALLLRIAQRQWEQKDEPGLQNTLARIADACENIEQWKDTMSGFWNDVCSTLLEAGKFDEVIPHLDKLAEMQRDRARTGLVRGWSRSNQMERAATELKHIGEPRSRATAMVFLARGEAAAGRKDAAARMLTEATELARSEANPFGKTEPLILGVETLAQWGDYDAAEQAAKQVAAAIPADTLVYSLYSGSQSDFYEMPFQIVVGRQTSWLLIARAQVRAGKIDEAIKTIDHIPDMPGARFMVERYRAYILGMVARELIRTGDRDRVQKLLAGETIAAVREAIEAELASADSEPPAQAATDAKPKAPIPPAKFDPGADRENKN